MLFQVKGFKLKTASQLTPKEIEAYRQATHRRKKQEEKALLQRKEKAWVLARQAAELLRDKFSATKVVVFGSLANDKYFTPWSDVDIAVWGLKMEDTFHAIGAVFDLSDEIALNLVDINTARRSILETIQKEGVDI
ncbi:MAG: nucleotidyltransferase domain-containing protein [Chloroflexi bacterium]|nr:MAG: nucleotidyltransferase domain-containing protein [Chloroflexota bacterium]